MAEILLENNRLKRRLSKTPVDRFWQWVVKTSGCWLWNGPTTNSYGCLGVNYQTITAHRFSWVLHHGPIPEGLWVLHKCDNRPCVNPDHLYLGTAKENGRDTRERQTAVRGERHGRHKLTEAQVREIRRKYIWWKVTQQNLSDEYKVSIRAIAQIIHKEKWKHVKA